MKFLLAGAAATLLVAGGPALAAKKPLRLPPTSKWHLEYSKDSCQITRLFGEGKQRVVFHIEQFSPGDDFWLRLTGYPVGIPPARDGKPVRLQFGPLEAEQKVEYFLGDVKSGEPAVIFRKGMGIAPRTKAQRKLEKITGESVDAPPISAARYQGVMALAVSGATNRNIVLDLGSMGKPFEAMQTCADELLHHWGIDVEAHHKLAREVKPTTHPQSWLRSRDYPKYLQTSGKMGIVHFRLDVNEAGKPTGCHIQNALGSEKFKKIVCDKLIERTNFKPALDAKLKPVASFYNNSVTFAMP